LEYRLLCYLIENRNKVLTKEEIFNNVWRDHFTSDGTLNVHIRHLREKIEENPDSPIMIQTIWGVGYTFVEQLS
jgi:two-component system response regulator RegX3